MQRVINDVNDRYTRVSLSLIEPRCSFDLQVHLVDRAMQLFALEAYRSLRWMTHLFDVSRTC